LLRFAGIGCIVVGTVWEVVATSRSRRDLLGGHWQDLKGPFYLIVFGAALVASAQRLLPQLSP
jgi:hypothetical protein